MLATGDRPAAAITLSAMGAMPVIKATPSDLAGFVLVMQTLLRILSFIAPRNVLCENGAFSSPTKATAQFVNVI